VDFYEYHIILYRPHDPHHKSLFDFTILTVVYTILLYLLNISEFVYFVCGLSFPKLCIVWRQNFTGRCVPIICRTSAGFYACRGHHYQNPKQWMTFFRKITCSRHTSQPRMWPRPLAAWMHAGLVCLSCPVFH